MTLRELQAKLNRLPESKALDLDFCWLPEQTQRFYGDSKIEPYTFLTDDGKLGHMGSMSCGPLLVEDL